MRYLFFLVGLLFACGQLSMEDFREKGREEIQGLIILMRQIHSRKELLEAQGNLQKSFEKLVDLMIEARTFREEHIEAESVEWGEEDRVLSEELSAEMHRLMALEGGEEILEKVQEKALYRLDEFEKRLLFKKQKAG